MRNIEEFSLEQAKDIQGKIDYIRINNSILKGYKFTDVLHGLIKSAISVNNYENLVAGRIIYFNPKNFSNTYEYMGWYYTVPKRKKDIIDRIIRVLILTNQNVDNIRVKFKEDAEELILHQQEVEAERLQKKIESDKNKYYASIINDEVTISDEELKDIIYEECAFGMKYGLLFDELQYERRINNLAMEREQLRQERIDKRKRHIDWLLNDKKQAELFNCSVKEYQAKYKRDNIMEIVG